MGVITSFDPHSPPGLPPGPAQDELLARATKRLEEKGFLVSNFENLVDWARTVARVREVVEKIHGVKAEPERLADLGVDLVLEGRARFVDPHTMELSDSGRRVRGDAVVLCVGGHSRRLPVPGAELALVPEQVLDMPEVPRRLAVVGAGNTGATMAAALLRMGRIRGVQRPAIAAPIPVPGTTRLSLLLDVGATVDPEPAWLVQWALLGREYAKVRLGIEEPTIALLSNGEEAGKGDELRKQSFALLADVKGFIGNVEGRDLLSTGADVIVTYDGNDQVSAGGGKDLVCSGAGGDSVFSQDGADTVIAGGGPDLANGGKSGDVLKGKAGRDRLKGKSGNDLLNGGKNRDSCKGGSGRDTLKRCP